MKSQLRIFAALSLVLVGVKAAASNKYTDISCYTTEFIGSKHLSIDLEKNFFVYEKDHPSRHGETTIEIATGEIEVLFIVDEIAMIVLKKDGEGIGYVRAKKITSSELIYRGRAERHEVICNFRYRTLLRSKS